MMHPNNKNPERRRIVLIVIGIAVAAIAVAVILLIRIPNFSFNLPFPTENGPTETKKQNVECSEDTPHADRPIMMRGDEGSCVIVLRAELTNRNYRVLKQIYPETFDSQLEKMVIQFQNDNQLEPHGTVEDKTWETIESTPLYTPEPVETIGSLGPEYTPPVTSPAPTPTPSAGSTAASSPPATPEDEESEEADSEEEDKEESPSAAKTPGSTVSPSPAANIDDEDYDTHTGPNTTEHVVLSYDDCPNSYAEFEAAIEAAEELDIGLVLAPTVECIEKKRFDVDVARSHGHFVINHSISHKPYPDMETEEIVANLTHPKLLSSFGRPPGGQGGFEPIDQKVVDAFEEANIRMWLWSVDPRDWVAKNTPEKVIAYIVEMTDTQDTVLLHMQHSMFNGEMMEEIQSKLLDDELTLCPNYGEETPSHPTEEDICQ